MRKVFFTLIVISLFVSCNRRESHVSLLEGGEEESDSFVTEALPLHGMQDMITDVIYVRFYDNNRYVPYVPVEYFLQECAEFSLENTFHAGKKHIYENNIKGKKFSFLVDAENDTIYCPEWYGYAALTDRTGLSEDDMGYFETLEKMMKYIPAFSEQKALIFDLKKYGFKIYSGIDDAYIPLCVMNQLFTICAEYRFVYNGKSVYVLEENGNGFNNCAYPSYMDSPWFTNDEGKVSERPKELITLSYNLLRFTHDYLYGKPGYYGFADDGTGYANEEITKAADSLDFDSMLKKYDPETKKQLLSSSYRDYFDGLNRLIYYTYGDLHASQAFRPIFPMSVFSEKEISDIDANGFNSPLIRKYLSHKWEKTLESREILNEKRASSGKKTNDIQLLNGGKTLAIRFDNFVMDSDGWASFYDDSDSVSSPNLQKIPQDTAGMFCLAFYFLQTEPKLANVENIIIDLSLNMGGAKDALHLTLPYIVGTGDVYMYDTHTGTKNRDYVQGIDINLDGKVTLEDVELCKSFREKYRFAVLTSFNSFSCGNYFSTACSDNGIPIIGERSGGGSCVVGHACTAEGFLFKYSSSYHLSHEDWTSVENGALVTKELSYDQFYDDDALQNSIDELVSDGWYRK